MKKILISLMIIIGVLGIADMKAQPFFDTSDPDKFVTFGARLGFNTSNRTFPKGNYYNYMMSSWGIGFNAGVVANLNFKEYLTLQPGFFYESRSGNLVNIVDYYKDLNTSYPIEATHYEVNHLRAYYFTIPVMGIAKFNLSENIKWSVEFGPYIQFSLKQTGQNNVQMLSPGYQNLGYTQYVAQHHGFDVGLKMGTGLKFYQHYYVGVHYLAGLTNAWKLPSGGKNKSWEFTIGYDF